MRAQLFHVDLRIVNLFRDPPCLLYLGVNRAELTDRFTVRKQERLLPGLEAFSAAGHKRAAFMHVEGCKQCFKAALKREEILARAAEGNAKQLALFRKIRVVIKVDIPDLKETRLPRLAAEVACERIECACKQRCAHQALILTEWVQKFHCKALLIAFGDA